MDVNERERQFNITIPA